MPIDPVPFPQNRFDLTVPALELQVGFFMQVQGLSAQIDVTEYAEGGNNAYMHKLPVRIKYSNLTLKRGMTDETALLAWFQATVDPDGPTMSTVTLELKDSTGKKVQAWAFSGAYPVKWSASDLNAGGTEGMAETLEIAHHGFSAA